MSLISQMFGLASSTLYIRCGGSGNNTQLALEALATGFGASTADGDYVYNLFNSYTGIFTNSGFDGTSPYFNLEGSVTGLGNGTIPQIGTAAIIFSYATFPNIEESLVVSFINTYLQNLSPSIGGGNYNYTIGDLDNVIQEINLSAIYSGITGNPTPVIQKAINYNWYDSSPLFINLNFEPQELIIRDVESQYYYLSGQLIYPSIPTGLTPCIQYTQIINTNTGQISINVIQNLPCYEPSSYIGPISGIQFFRKFSDGPGSSGEFTDEIISGYAAFDKAVLNPVDYSSNNVVVYSREFDSSGYYYLLDSGVQTDINGYYYSGNEYGRGHSNYWNNQCPINGGPDDCVNLFISSWPLERMHQGDNQPKTWLVATCVKEGESATCVYDTGIFNWTGWKFARLELNDSLENNFKFLKMNPKIDLDRVVKRALNLDNNSILGEVISPYLNAVDTGDGIITCTGAVGPPQLNGNSTLPGLAFWQTFYNRNFPDKIQIGIRPSTSSFQDGYLGYEVSNFDLFSGINLSNYEIGGVPSLSIYKSITSAEVSQYDDIFKQCVTIGDNVGTNSVWQSTNQLNAGFAYTGYIAYDSSGNVITYSSLAPNIKTVGSKYSQIKYIVGYSGSGQNYLVQPQYGYIITGDTSSGINYLGEILEYYYFNDGVLGAANTGWDNQLAPLPQTIINDIQSGTHLYSPIYDYQEVENYTPRYVSGPYLSYNEAFLYPNAEAVTESYGANTNGFPNSVYYQITVKEETVREIYKIVNKNNTTLYINVIRTTGDGGSGQLLTTMITPFNGDGYGANQYDIKNYPTGTISNFQYFGNTTLMVDQNYIPSTNFCTQTQLNDVIQGTSTTPAYSSYWSNGVRITGIMTPRTVYIGTGGLTGQIYALQPQNQMPLYWAYSNITVSGTMNYTPPIFDLSSNSVTPQQPLTQNMDNIGTGLNCYQTPASYSFNGSQNNYLNRTTDYIVPLGNFNGQDPIFFEYIGGRVGLGAELEGGYHDEGIIGDAWYDFYVGTWGNSNTPCLTCIESIGGDEFSVEGKAHNPDGDSNIFFFALNQTGLNIYTKGLNYSPYYFDYIYKPFNSTLPTNIGIGLSRNKQSNGEYYFDADLKTVFPMISSGISELYYPSGLNIGPFDRDVELCVLQGRSIIPSGSLIIDDQMMTINATGANPSCTHYINGIALNSGIIPGQYGRNLAITTFKLIPAGITANINLSGSGFIGMTGASIMTVRPRTFIGANINTYTTSMGDEGFLNNFNYIFDGNTSLFSMPSNQFANLQGQSTSFITSSNESYIYPLPDSEDFDATVGVTLDSFGNKIYPNNPTRVYWLNKNPFMYFSGMREVSRVNITINKMSVTGITSIPYQSFQNIIPSGECIVSGVFAYTGEAESAVITDGIYLSGIYGANALSGKFTPLYISDVLQRLPTGIYQLPSGSGISPVLPAPSLIVGRKNPFYITGNDKYVPLFPEGITGDYNEFLWPAWSDLGLLNPEVVYEQMPPDDGNTFLSSYLTFSASQGQRVGTGFNKSENVTYGVVAQYAFIDSLSTNAILNTGICIFQGETTAIQLDSGNLNSILTTEGTALTLAIDLA